MEQFRRPPNRRPRRAQPVSSLLKLLLPAFALVAVSLAQPDTAWLFRYPNSEPLAFFADDTGNIYIVGWSEKREERRDVLLLKIDSTGHLVWNRTYDNVTAVGAVRDKYGNIYVSGAAGGGRVCLMKYKPNGDIGWLASYGGRDNPCSVMGSIAIDDSQNVYVCGVAESASCAVVRIIKYRQNGELATVKSCALRETTLVYYRGFHILNDGGAYLTIDEYGPGGWPCHWLIVRLSGQGQVLWKRTYRDRDSTWDDIRCSQVDENASIYITGQSTRPEGFRTLKMDSSGKLIWTAVYPHTSSSDGGDDFLLLNKGSVYVASGASDTISLVKYDSFGNQLWHSKYGSGDFMLGYGQGYDDPRPGFCCMSVDDAGNIYLTGQGDTTYARGKGRGIDSIFAFLLKYDPQGKLVWARKRPWTGQRPDGLSEVSWEGAIVGFDKKGALYDIGVGGADVKRAIYVLKYRTR